MYFRPVRRKGVNMQKISTLKLTRLTVSGFKCFACERGFELDDVTFITGGNHVGKSSIADAIAFAFTGKLYNGDSSIDRLYSEQSPSLRIIVSLLDEKGAAHELVRTRVNDKMTIAYDGYNIRQKDLDIMFGESDVFLSIFNPTFFIERLGNDGQKLLQTYLPLVPHEEVLANLTLHQRTLLEHQVILSPDTFIKNLREENREFQENIIALEGQKALLHKQKSDGKKALADMLERISGLEQEICGLRQKRENGIGLKDLEEKRANLLLRRDELLSDKPKEPRTAQLDVNIRRAETELETIAAKRYESKYAAETAKLRAELQSDGEAYRKALAVFQNIRPGVTCPTCLRLIDSPDNVEGIKAELNRGLQEMVRLGTDKRNQLTELTELDNKSLDVFEQFKNSDMEKQRERVAQLQERRNAVLAQPREYETSLDEINKQIAGVEASLDFGGLTAGEMSQLTELETEKEKLSADHAAMEALMERPAPDVDAQRKGFEDAIRHNGELISAAIDYLGARNELTFQNLPLQKVAFSLFDVFKTTGEVKNAFRFTYNGRDYRRLSHSEKIFAGMEVSELIKALTKRNYPVFVDDSESVVSLAGIPTGQVFLSRVVPNQPLTVAVRGNRREEFPKAG